MILTKMAPDNVSNEPYFFEETYDDENSIPLEDVLYDEEEEEEEVKTAAAIEEKVNTVEVKPSISKQKKTGNRGKDVRLLANSLIEENFSKEEQIFASKLFELFHTVYYKKLSDNILKKLRTSTNGSDTESSGKIPERQEQFYFDLLLKLIVLMR